MGGELGLGGGEFRKFWSVGGDSPHPPPTRENPGGVLGQSFILTSFTICCSPLLVLKVVSFVIHPNEF